MTVSTSVIKAVSHQDKELCYKVRLEVFCKEQKQDEELQVDCYDEVCDHWLAIDDSDPSNPLPVGASRLVQYVDSRDKKVGKIGRVAVLSSHRGRGIAKQLMFEMESYAKTSSHLDKLVLHSIADKPGFYLKLAYNLDDPDKEPFEELRIPCVSMSKDIR